MTKIDLKEEKDFAIGQAMGILNLAKTGLESVRDFDGYGVSLSDDKNELDKAIKIIDNVINNHGYYEE